jgi:hypothetical protein
MSVACSTHGRDEKCVQYFTWKTAGRDYLRDLHVDTHNIKMDLKEIGYEGCGLDSSGTG